MLVIGTSCAGTPVQTSFQSAATDFAVQFADAVRVPAHPQRQDRHAKRIGGVDPRLAEGEKFVERQIRFRWRNLPKYLRIISRGKASLPAGTGVWVVKTLADATTCRAE